MSDSQTDVGRDGLESPLGRVTLQGDYTSVHFFQPCRGFPFSHIFHHAGVTQTLKFCKSDKYEMDIISVLYGTS